ncbi:Uma2 family endonuclease [Cohnella sp. CFH 77786]|uniref:Uma2 family endonuclease n=1 Tax=Cohnella sp. CFH 77786 TaxID=2662265 RepID=UPI001C6107D2|nr:Uma2 family endonuclease [Cohnella sp. CFH 77786]
MSDDAKSSKPNEKVKEQSIRYMVEDRHEIIDGVRYDFLSSPKLAHQTLLGNLYVAFHGACAQEGRIILAPMDVHFDEANRVQPDLIYVAKENLAILRDGFVFGVPDLLVEILSESTGRHDKKLKKALFERFGVREYWIADPVYRLIEQFVLTDGRYLLVSTLSEQEELVSPTIPCLRIPLSGVFPGDE